MSDLQRARSSTDLERHLKTLELKLLSPSTRQNEHELRVLIAEDFVEFGASGNVWSRADVVEGLGGETPIIRTADEFSFRHLGEDVVLVTYRCCAKPAASDAGAYSLRSSLWRRQADNWQMIFHQGTPVT
jgi:hypothetical protein